MHELWLPVESECKKISVQECAKLFESIPRCISAVIKAKGVYTKNCFFLSFYFFKFKS